MDASNECRGHLPPRDRTSAQVIIVGASLSGLQAAFQLQQAGLTCLVLEAENVIAPEGAHTVGEIVHSTTQPRTCQLARDLGVDLTTRQGSGRDVIEGFGASDKDGIPQLVDNDRRSFARVRNNIESLCDKVDVNRPAYLYPNYGTMSVHEAFVSQGATPTVQQLANAWTLSIFGLASKSISALHFLLYCKSVGGLTQMLANLAGGGQNMWLPGGHGRLREELLIRLAPNTVCLSQEVTHIEQSTEKCVLLSASGVLFQCSRIILADPLICSSTKMIPPLSDDKQWLRSDFMQGSCSSITLAYQQPWWRQLGFSGHAIGLHGPVTMVNDTSCDVDGRYSLTCTLPGGEFEEKTRTTGAALRQSVSDQMKTIFGSGVPSPNHVFVPSLTSGTWVPRRKRLAIPANRLFDLERDQWKPEGHIHFAGSETSFIWKGHTEGALASGSRAAEEVMTSLVAVYGALESKL